MGTSKMYALKIFKVNLGKIHVCTFLGLDGSRTKLRLSGVGQGGVDALASFPENLASLFLNFSYNSDIRSLASICQSIRAVAQTSLKFPGFDETDLKMC